MNLNNTVIKVLDKEHGQKVKKFFEENGVDTENHSFVYTENAGRKYIYYGLNKGNFSNYSLKDVNEHNIKIIELPMENTIKIGDETIDLNLPFPRKMEVWDNSVRDSKIELVHAIINRSSISKVIGDVFLWKYCKELPQVKKMTVAEVEKELGYRIEIIS